MSRLIELFRSARECGDWGPLADAIPYTRFLGITADSGGGELIGKMTFSEKLVGNPALPALHGGAIGALLEATAVFELLNEAETVVLPKTINITVDYLRSGKPLDTFARGVITKQGRRVASVQVSAWQEDRDRPIATANAHFLVEPVDVAAAGATPAAP